MKKTIIAFLCLVTTIGIAHAQESNTPDPNAGKFTFTEETHDYGAVPEGPLAECDFVFTNTGKTPIVIRDARGSCGCTVPVFPHEPIKPGEQGKIHVTYNTAGRPGSISKEVTILSNAQQPAMVLHIRGSVTAKPAEVQQPPAVGAVNAGK